MRDGGRHRPDHRRGSDPDRRHAPDPAGREPARATPISAGCSPKPTAYRRRSQSAAQRSATRNAADLSAADDRQVSPALPHETTASPPRSGPAGDAWRRDDPAHRLPAGAALPAASMPASSTRPRRLLRAVHRLARRGSGLRRAAAQPGLSAIPSGSRAWSQLAEQRRACATSPPATSTTTVPERHRLQDVLVAIHHRTTLDGCHRERRPNAEFYLRSAEEMAELFAEYPEALATTLADRRALRSFNLANDLDYPFPDYPTETGRDAGRRPAPGLLRSASTSAIQPDEYRGGRSRLERRAARHRQAQPGRLLPALPRSARAGRGRSPTRCAATSTGARARQSAAGPRARLVGQLDRLLPDRPLARRSAQAQPLLRPLPERGAALDPRYRPRFPARDPRAADRAGLRALRARARGAGLRLLHLQAAQRRARRRQGARHPAGRSRQDRQAERAAHRPSELGEELARMPGVRRPQGRAALVAT